MKKKSTISLLAMLSVISIILSGCGNTGTKGNTNETSAPKEIVIGNIGAMSGPSASLGKAQSQGVDLAVKEINANGGILGAQIKIVKRDDEADPTKSKTYVEELVDKEKVKFIIGPTNSTPAAASIAYLQQNKIISILPIATSTTLMSKDNPYAFRLLPSNFIQAKSLVTIAAKKGYKNIALVADTSALGVDGMSVMEATLKEVGISPAVKVTFKSDDQDMTPVAQKIKDANADVALFWTLGADGAKIVRALERLDYIANVDIIGYTGLVMANFKELAGPGASQCAAVGIKNWALADGKTELAPKYQDMYKKIIAEYGPYEPGKRDTNPSTVASGYDAIYLLKWAIEKAGTTDADAVKNVLETNVNEYESGFVSKYVFSKDSHEGYSPNDMVPVAIGEMINGDLYKQK